MSGAGPITRDAVVRELARLGLIVDGGASAPDLLDTCWQRLRSGGRLVVNAVTLETQASLIAQFKSRGGHLAMLQVSHAGRVGDFFAWRPAMAVTQWSVTKP